MMFRRGGDRMHKIKSKEDFIIITGSNIIKNDEAKLICEELMIELANGHITNLILDVQSLDLDKSKFDIFINYLSRMNLNCVALVLPKLISSLKFKLWKRKYNNYLELKQFNNLNEAKQWIKEGS